MRAALGVHDSRHRARGTTGAALLLGLVVLLTLPGCGGCRDDDPAKTEAEKEAKRLEAERERKQPDFEIDPPVAEPCVDPLQAEKDEQKVAAFFYKPGHWTSAVFPAKANKEDFVGDLDVELVAGPKREPIRLGDSPFSLAESREAALAKGQKKLLHSSLFVPEGRESVSALASLSARKGSYRQYEATYPLRSMPSYQYHFAVLARAPDRYGYLKTLPSIKPPSDELTDERHGYHYRVELLKTGSRGTALPDGAMFWTSIAYALWDDVDPDALSFDQRKALVDWLHWGGQLIVSGPDTLDTLRGSFLANYLPASAAGPWELIAKDFDEINKHFTLKGQSRLAPTGAWSGVKLKLADGARFVPSTGELLAERRVGRGRVVVSAVRLSDRGLVAWPGFDGFFNACLLRRPPRKYRETPMAGVELTWADPKLPRWDAAQNCQLRYFTRDTGIANTAYGADMLHRDGNQNDLTPETRVPDAAGVAAWRGVGPAPDRAREALQNAARVEIPTRWFVVWVVAGYVVILVPLNWLVFRGLDRVEWAWIAAPVIALGSTVAVIRMAQLDIGFARSETELAVLELQSSYPRAHLTRYTALYTSLTTRYSFRHEDAGAVVQPFRVATRRDDSPATLHYRHGNEASLEGFVVPSNTVDMIHGEQMIDLDGPIELMRNARGRWQVSNRTGLELRGVGVLRCVEADKIETAWVGDMGLGASAELTFVQQTDNAGGAAATAARDSAGARKPPPTPVKKSWWAEQRDAVIETTSTPVIGEFNLRKLIDLAEDAAELRPGEFRLIGLTDRRLPGLTIVPAAPQSRHAAVVVAHLVYAPEGDPQPDVNAREDAMKNENAKFPTSIAKPQATPPISRPLTPAH